MKKSKVKLIDDYYEYDNFVIDLKSNKIIKDNSNSSQTDGFIEYFNNNVKKIVFVDSIDDSEDTDDSICYIVRD